MTDDFYFFSNDCNNWNYNPYINTPNADPYNLKRTINITGNNSYNIACLCEIKYFCCIVSSRGDFLNYYLEHMPRKLVIVIFSGSQFSGIYIANFINNHPVVSHINSFV